MDRTHTTQPKGGDPGTVDWQGTGEKMLADVGQFLPALRAEIDKIPVGYRGTLINLYDELGGSYETWCQQLGVAPSATTFAVGKAAT